MAGSTAIDRSPAVFTTTPPRIAPIPGLTPFLKWPGGKTQELAAIAAAAPALTGRFIDPFVGGGSVLLATPADVPAVANDACRDLVELYTSAAGGDRLFRQRIDGLARAWDGLAELDSLYAQLGAAFTAASATRAVSAIGAHEPALHRLLDVAGPGLGGSFNGRAGREVVTKFGRMRRLEIRHDQRLNPADLLANVEGSVRSSFYMSIRARYNEARLANRWDATRAADFLFLREFTYAAMFRFNAQDAFNVPYGGISYNRKSLADKARLLFSEPMLARLANTQFESRDFEPFLAVADPIADDFVFVDPPYDSDFSAYDNRPFESLDQARLQVVLAASPARIMVVIKDAPAIRALYRPDRWNVIETPKTYMWTIKSRNDRRATHLTITNYEVPA